MIVNMEQDTTLVKGDFPPKKCAFLTEITYIFCIARTCIHALRENFLVTHNAINKNLRCIVRRNRVTPEFCAERIHELPPISARNGVAYDTIFLGPFGFGQMMRAKQPIINWKVRGIVDINRRPIRAMVPMMKPRSDKEAFQKPQLPTDIGVDKTGIKIDDQQICLDRFGHEA